MGLLAPRSHLVCNDALPVAISYSPPIFNHEDSSKQWWHWTYEEGEKISGEREREREREANLEKKERKIKRLLCGFFLVLQMALVPTTNIGREERMRSIWSLLLFCFITMACGFPRCKWQWRMRCTRRHCSCNSQSFLALFLNFQEFL